MREKFEIEYDSLHDLRKGVTDLLVTGHKVVDSRHIEGTKYALTYSKKRKNQYTKVVAVDFDGTLCKGGCYPEVGEPNMHVIEYVNYLHHVKGYEVILWTCRAGEPLEKAIYWCAEHNIHIDSVNAPAPSQNFPGPSSCKVYADIYLDDRAKNVNEIDGTYMPITTTKIPMPPVKEPKNSIGSLTVDVGVNGTDETIRQLHELKGLYKDIDTLQQRIIKGAEHVEKIAERCSRISKI